MLGAGIAYDLAAKAEYESFCEITFLDWKQYLLSDLNRNVGTQTRPNQETFGSKIELRSRAVSDQVESKTTLVS
jgi:hypothetical protein